MHTRGKRPLIIISVLVGVLFVLAVARLLISSGAPGEPLVSPTPEATHEPTGVPQPGSRVDEWVGQWRMSEQKDGESIELDLELRADGTFVSQRRDTDSTTAEEMPSTVEGQWQIDNTADVPSLWLRADAEYDEDLACTMPGCDSSMTAERQYFVALQGTDRVRVRPEGCEREECVAIWERASALLDSYSSYAHHHRRGDKDQ